MNMLKRLIALIMFCGTQEGISQMPFAHLYPGKQLIAALVMQPKLPLQLTTSVVKKQYCKSETTGKISLQMKLQLRYVNLGGQPLILYKSSSDIIEFIVGRSLDDMTAGQFEVRATQTIVNDGKPLHVDDLQPNKYFEVISPGKSFKAKTELFLEILSGKNNSSSSALIEGKHYLQIKVLTWPLADSSPSNVRDQWKNIGVLWSDNIVSIPMQFTIEKPPTLPLCTAIN